MACYHFNQRRGSLLIKDDEGTELPGLEAARAEAIAAAREAMQETIKQGFLPLSWSFEISDDRGRVILRVPFSDAVKLFP
ncbi:MAG: hypothetical protein JWL62_3251 [Hyphomicrobiales bacterium]|nr:hypothetical protein [Hyphomicrobiales bacterium]